MEKLMVPLEKYLESGIHIGPRYRSGFMKRFIYKYRDDGLCVLNIAQIDERIRIAAKMLSRYQNILVVAGRKYAQKPAKKFAELVGAKCVAGRFIPGTLTNPKSENFVEPDVVLVADPPVDRQALIESRKVKVPVIALADASALTRNIDLVIPCNNKGKKSIALAFWLLAREVLKERGIIKSYDEFKVNPEEFMEEGGQ